MYRDINSSLVEKELLACEGGGGSTIWIGSECGVEGLGRKEERVVDEVCR